MPRIVQPYPSYTYDSNNIPADNTSVIYQDPGKVKLMDGAVCYITTDASFQQQGWVWFDNAAGTAYNKVILYADYGSVKEFSNLSLNYASDSNSVSATKLWAPSDVNLSFSNDGVTYGTPVSLTGWYQGTTTDTNTVLQTQKHLQRTPADMLRFKLPGIPLMPNALDLVRSSSLTGLR